MDQRQSDTDQRQSDRPQDHLPETVFGETKHDPNLGQARPGVKPTPCLIS
jgi:hypothetical protein